MSLVLIQAEDLANLISEVVAREVAPLKEAIGKLSKPEEPEEPAEDPVEPEQPEQPGVMAQLSSTSGGEWKNGISLQVPRFLLEDTPKARAAFVAGQSVRFSDGQIRTIKSQSAQFNKLYVSVEGGKLSPDVGHPNVVTLRGEVADEAEEPEPARPAPKRRGVVGVNLGMGSADGNGVRGVQNRDYRLPVESEIIRAKGLGFTKFRVHFLWERCIQPGFKSELNMQGIKEVIEVGRLCKRHGCTVLWDLFHNYGGYSPTNNKGDRKKVGAAGGPSVERFALDWKAVIAEIKKDRDCWDATYGIDLMNEWAGVPYSTVFAASQAFLDHCAPIMDDKIAAIEGIHYSSTANWVANNPDFDRLKDPRGKGFIEYSGHLYLDHDASGFYEQGDSVSTADKARGYSPASIGTGRIAAFAKQLQEHGVYGSIGETIVPGNFPNLLTGLSNLLEHNIENGIDTYLFGLGDWFGKSDSTVHNLETARNKKTLELASRLAKAG